MTGRFPLAPLGEVLRPVSRPEPVGPGTVYRILGAHWYAKGLYIKDIKPGSEIQADKLYRVEHGDFIYNRLFAWKGSFAVATEENHGCYVSNEFPCFIINRDRAEGKYLWSYFRRASAWDEALSLSSGGTPTSRNRLREEKLLAMKIPLPSLDEQRRIVAQIDELTAKTEEACALRREAVQEAEALLSAARVDAFQGASAKGWIIKKLEEVALISMGQSPPGYSYNALGDGIPLLNGPTEFGEPHPRAVQWTTAPTTLCRQGDILLCVRGATTGRMNWADKKYCIGRGLAALTPNPELCAPEFAYHFVETQTQQMLALAAGSTFPNLPGEKLKTLEIPIPPLSKQRSTVNHLNEVQSGVVALKRLQGETAAELNALLPSILDKAFKGEL